jgi:hypothetical protein
MKYKAFKALFVMIVFVCMSLGIIYIANNLEPFAPYHYVAGSMFVILFATIFRITKN